MKTVGNIGSESSELSWDWYRLEAMTPHLLYALMAFRESVFVVEQKCIYQELDGLDTDALHLVGCDAGSIVACLRILPPAENSNMVQIGRVAVAQDRRYGGVARAMMQIAIDRIRREQPSVTIFLNAQSYLQDFYRSLGFRLCGDEFMEDGIPHVPMGL